MKIKFLIGSILSILSCMLGAAVTNNPATTSTNPLFSVMVNSNGVLQKPAAFFLTNKTAIGTGLGITNKGDLVAGTGSNIAVRTVGTQGQVLTADTNSPTGLSWLPGGAGSVTNVGFSADTNIYTVSGSPITNTGTITLNMATQAVGTALMSPATSNGLPTFRRIAATDLPGGINASNIGSGSISSEEFGFLDGLATNLTVSLSNKIDASTMTSKGDLLGYTGTAPTRVPYGVNGQVLSVDMSTASGMRWITAPGVGTVTSIGLSAPAQFGVSNSPVTSSGTITLTNVHQAANTFWSGPSSGSPAGPTFRTMTTDDLPAAIPWSKISTGLVDTNEFGYLDGLTNNIQNQLTFLNTNTTVNATAVGSISMYDTNTTASYRIAGVVNRIRTQFGIGNGSLGPWGSWIQSSYDNTGGSVGVSPLLLNPSGGSVGIGTNTPQSLLHVGGTFLTEGLTTIKNTLTLGGYDAGNPAWTVTGTSNLTAARYGGGNLNELTLRANRTILSGPFSDSLFIGSLSGNAATAGDSGMVIGKSAAQTTTNVNSSVIVGALANAYGQNSTESVIIGCQTGADADTALGSVMIGTSAGWGAKNTTRSVLIGAGAGLGAVNSEYAIIQGFYSGYYASNANNAIILGTYAGFQATNSINSILIGLGAGKYVNRNNTLIIDSQATAEGTNAFMYGELDNKMLRINGSLDVTNRFTLNQYLPITTNLQVLVPGSKTNTLYITNGLIMRISNP